MIDKHESSYLGTTDSDIVNQTEKFAHEVGNVETFVGVAEGFACFTLIEKIRPQKIILYDRNAGQLKFFDLIRAVVRISSDPHHFVSRLLSRPDFLEVHSKDETLLADTLNKLKKSSDFDPSWKTILLALANAQSLDRGIYFTPDANRARPLFVLDPINYDLKQKELKKYLYFGPLSLHLGQGWLKDRESFEYIKNRLTEGEVHI